MEWKLDQRLFRRLVGLYSASFVLVIAYGLFESFGPASRSFSDEFDLLVARHYGVQDETRLLVGLPLALVGLVWHIAAILGLFRFRRWARLSFWMSMAFTILAICLTDGMRPAFGSPIGTLASEVSTGLFAVVLLLLYSTEHGAVWFRTPLETLKEIF